MQVLLMQYPEWAVCAHSGILQEATTIYQFYEVLAMQRIIRHYLSTQCSREILCKHNKIRTLKLKMAIDRNLMENLD